MNNSILTVRLAQADKEIAFIEAAIARTIATIEQLKGLGVSTKVAQGTLELYQVVQSTNRAHREHLYRQASRMPFTRLPASRTLAAV